jgi:branched-chain amino acid transport system permease protein/urea transport system permease protein
MVSIGLGITYRSMNVINLAHGDMITLGAYIVFCVQGFLDPLLGAVIAAVVLLAFGYVTFELLLEKIHKKVIPSILATWGMGTCVRQSLIIAFGAGYQRVESPLLKTIRIIGVDYPLWRLCSIIVSSTIIFIVWYIFSRTNLGLKLRATIQNDILAETKGINTSTTKNICFGIGCALAGFSGALLSPILGVNPFLGLSYLLISFFVAVLGHSIIGFVVWGAIFGTIGYLISTIINPPTSDLTSLILGIILLAYIGKAVEK